MRTAKWRNEVALAEIHFPCKPCGRVVDQLSSLGIAALGPVVVSTILIKNKVVREENLFNGVRTDGVIATGSKVNETGVGDIAEFTHP